LTVVRNLDVSSVLREARFSSGAIVVRAKAGTQFRPLSMTWIRI
jgi:hypothetical protein